MVEPVSLERIVRNADLIVTRHAGLVEVLRALGSTAPVIPHATADDVRGKAVLGVLPMHLAQHAYSVTEIALDLPPELRGKELTADQVRLYMRGAHEYRVTLLATSDAHDPYPLD